MNEICVILRTFLRKMLPRGEIETREIYLRVHLFLFFSFVFFLPNFGDGNSEMLSIRIGEMRIVWKSDSRKATAAGGDVRTYKYKYVFSKNKLGQRKHNLEIITREGSIFSVHTALRGSILNFSVTQFTFSLKTNREGLKGNRVGRRLELFPLNLCVSPCVDRKQDKFSRCYSLALFPQSTRTKPVSS